VLPEADPHHEGEHGAEQPGHMHHEPAAAEAE
jgi:hypothetical protein